MPFAKDLMAYIMSKETTRFPFSSTFIPFIMSMYLSRALLPFLLIAGLAISEEFPNGMSGSGLLPITYDASSESLVFFLQIDT